MIEAVDLTDLIVESPTHDQPHDHFDALGTGFSKIVAMRQVFYRPRVGRQFVEEIRVEFPVDQTCALALKLMRKTAGADDGNSQIFGVGLDRFTNGFTQFITTTRLWLRILNDIHTQWDYRTGPCFWLVV